MADDRTMRRIRHLSDALEGSPRSDCSTPLQRQGCRADELHEAPNKVVTADEAVARIKDGSIVTVAGFVGSGPPDSLFKALRQRYDSTSTPRNLSIIFLASVGNSKGAGLDVLATEGLVEAVTYGWIGSCPKLGRMVLENKIRAHNLPLGVLSHMMRDIAAKRIGPITKTGLGTFVDPREKGGKRNSRTTEDVVSLMTLNGEEYLHYKPPRRIDVALLRGTTADLAGNVSFEREVLYLDQLHQAMAARNSGGLVIVQVERVVDRHSLPSRAVHLHASLVDLIVVAEAADHPQSYAPGAYDGALSGEVRAPLHAIARLPMNERKIIAHRAFLEIDTLHCLVNLGVGIPEGVAVLKASHGRDNPAGATATLTTEAGVFGGIPAGGLRFGSGYNCEALVPTASMIDFYSGGGVDVCVLGMAEVDGAGNVNVHNFGTRAPGCGGFIDISQSSKKCVFVGTFTSGGLKVSIQGGKLVILQEGRTRKFIKAVVEKTFAAALSQGRPVLYVTERAVFRPLVGEGRLELVEVAPGVDIARDVLAHMDFEPVVRHVKLMDPRIFQA
ncbi:hypothetical protein ACKKBG_A27390 [Auxenochlorella protothecoides x Auxenochlorella symbiontica]|uniref:Succinyl-CoA:3-ketoacid-coenzyme A transferase n=1 Tax=Auxenochlorella protothecoides TaxID=3075 RepID=A0A087SGS4_AUXPR|nr:Acetate CoA-transferase YdiF [Auxenochlorella protothecoides]KFM24928.1 Acetate CoA-transferase YdiF [Auxenochlorella protothecoides]